MDADEKEMEQKMIKAILGMPEQVRDRFKALHMLSEKRNKLNDHFNQIVDDLSEKVYKEQRVPVNTRFEKIVDGEYEP